MRLYIVGYHNDDDMKLFLTGAALIKKSRLLSNIIAMMTVFSEDDCPLKIFNL